MSATHAKQTREERLAAQLRANLRRRKAQAKALDAIQPDATCPDAPLPNSEFRYNANWGVLRLTLSPGHFGWRFVPIGGGAPIDVGTATCHR